METSFISSNTVSSQQDPLLQLVLTHLPAFVWRTDTGLKVTHFFASHQLHLANNDDFYQGLPLESLFNQLDLPGIPLQEVTPALSGKIAIFSREQDGHFWQFHIKPFFDGNASIVGTIGIGIDRTDKQHFEKQVLGKHRMETIGRLAGGVAHDFNNIITIIENYSQFVLDQLKEEEAIYQDVTEIRRAAKRAAQLTKQLLTYGRYQFMKRQLFSLNNTINDLRQMLSILIRPDIDLNISLAPDLTTVYADPSQIEQIILNLIINAIDAMPKGGQLNITTSPFFLDKTFARQNKGSDVGKYALLCIQDTGIGMDDQTKNNIFEPFFTTKAPGSGTGLGLSIVYGIIKQIGGYIRVESEPGKGASFFLYIPTHAPS